MRTFRYIALLLLLAVSAQVAQAQQFSKKKRYWSIAMTLDAMSYFGDIVPQNTMTSADLSFTRPKIGFYGMRRLTPNISFRGGMSYGRLLGDDAISSPKAVDKNPDSRFTNFRNLHFRNDISELSGMFVFDFIQNRGMFYQRSSKLIPYAFVGLGLVYHNPKARTPLKEAFDPALYPDLDDETPWAASGGQGAGVGYGEWVNLRDYQTEGVKYSPLTISIPFGLGVRYKVSNRVDVAFEVGYRWTFTDYLDDVSTRYQAFDDPNSLAALLANRSLELKSNSGVDRTSVLAEMSELYNGNLAAFSIPQSETYYGERRGNDGTPYTNPNARKAIFNGANDVYMVYGFHLNYILAMGVQCPKFRR